MDKYDLLKSVILRTKSFKAIVLLVLVLCCIIFTFQSSAPDHALNQSYHNVNNIEELELKVHNDDAGSSQEINAFYKESEEKHEDFKPVKSDQNEDSIEDLKSLGIQTVVQEGVKIMDMFADTDSEQYQAFKSMLTLWNPESSKWAQEASRKYKKALNLRQPRPRDWYDEPEKGDRRIKRVVDVEQCGCKREILAHTMVTYEGGDHGNSSISTCSHHSFHRGAKQKVMLVSIGCPRKIDTERNLSIHATC